ncbi:hypothetical protein PBCVAN69C_544R [Paramecium bursaria Chlorella virus AN69C]|uniref:Uncharacterized protein n=1 Tax=Paramecium bursaria Chlorella virus IL3A TaxID=46019 RepID=M1HUZ8_PBCVI|nr:hypothetical protein PBCVAN69C_544R [Paramecium bursaria Chlorella virus AN69C]AGE54004.1 hypothetical protein PBCVIL3A_622L [Paramecium bursaria Chlorella virus IL3A]AGE57439.1 hypothetical protein PBCVNEJV4_646L [Paramecium bursaria Chlorella virus NE-JV-4]
MKKRYIFGLVLLALFALAGMGSVVYMNWSDIKDMFSETIGINKKSSLKQIDVRVVKPDQSNVVQKDIKEILDIPEDDPKLKKDLSDIQKTKTSTDAKINTLTKTAVDTIKKESKVVKDKAPKLAAIVVDNVKKNELNAQKSASSKYVDLIKQIEQEKMKASVFLTGNITEKEKIAKINNIDAEIEIVDNFKVDSVKKVWTKKMAEYMVMKGRL